MLITVIGASITLIGLIVVPAILGGYAESLIRIKRNQSVEVGDFFTPGFKKNRWVKLLLAAIVYCVGVGLFFKGSNQKIISRSVYLVEVAL